MIDESSPEGTRDLPPEDVVLGQTILDEEGEPFLVMEAIQPAVSDDGNWQFYGEDQAYYCTVPAGMLVRRILPSETAVSRLSQSLADRGRTFDPVRREWSGGRG